MRNRVITGLLLVLLSCLPTAAAPQCAQEILAKAKQALGGDSWDVIHTTYSKGKLTTSGLTGQAESWEDNLTGRYVEKYQLGPASGADGFDGKLVWSQDSSGEPRAEGAENARQGAADEAYRNAMAYWFPQRWEAQIECLGRKEEQGKPFDVLRITPQGGRPFDLWVDAATYLIDHTVEKADIETRTTYFSDYRTVNGLKVPFAVRSTNGEQRYDQNVTLEKVEFNVPIQEAQFRMPQPPPPDFAIAGGKSSTTVPFELLNNHIYVEVKLNDKGAIVVDDYSRTSVPNIYAVGDVTDRINLTPVAIREAAAFAATVFGDKPTSFDHEMVATAVFSQPPIGCVGMTETEARRAGRKVDIYATRFRAMKHVFYGGQERVLMKLVVDADSDVILGCHIVGPEAAEMIQMAAIAVKMGVTKADWDNTCAVHPTLAEELVTMREKRPDMATSVA